MAGAKHEQCSGDTAGTPTSMRDPTPTYQPRELLRRLVAADIRFVVIGATAAQFQGSDVQTFDLDICYARDPENLGRLAGVLVDIHATLRNAPSDLPFRIDARTLQDGDAFTFATDFGAFDILGTVASTSGRLDYEVLSRTAVPFRFESDAVIELASLDDLIAMKRAAGRPKDLLFVEYLGALRDELDRR
jgi:hypothetical protein